MRGRLYTYRYTVTSRMTPALRWAAMRAILMFHNCEGQSHKTVSTDHNFNGSCAGLDRKAGIDCSNSHQQRRPANREGGIKTLFVDVRAQGLFDGRDDRPGFPVPNSPYGLCGRKAALNCSISELRGCVNLEVAVLGSACLIVLTVSVDIKQH